MGHAQWIYLLCGRAIVCLPPHFYYENFILTPKDVWTVISRFVYGIRRFSIVSLFSGTGYVEVTLDRLRRRHSAMLYHYFRIIDS